jgi:hypothetical protein
LDRLCTPGKLRRCLLKVWKNDMVPGRDMIHELVDRSLHMSFERLRKERGGARSTSLAFAKVYCSTGMATGDCGVPRRAPILGNSPSCGGWRSATDFSSTLPGAFLVRHLFADWRKLFGKFFASPGFGFTEKKLHLPNGRWSFCESRLEQMWAIAISFKG